ncbi:MAG: GNAT family N-acetyltransferase [Verrucomicrobiota bacterium]
MRLGREVFWRLLEGDLARVTVPARLTIGWSLDVWGVDPDFRIMEASEVEKAALQAWPGIEEVDYEEYVLKWAKEITKRANSLNVFDKVSAVEKVIEIGEAYYEGKGLEPIFRIPSYTGNEEMDAALQGRGYGTQDLSWVMVKGRAEVGSNRGNDGVMIEVMEVDEWLELYGKLKSMGEEELETQLGIVRKIGEGGFGLAARLEGKAVCCGLGVVKNGFCGAFNLFTLPGARRRGWAEKLMRALEWEGSRRGAENGFYLQVVADNAGAISLYEKIGYGKLYEYWYRVKGLEG